MNRLYERVREELNAYEAGVNGKSLNEL
jgi:hypothetical protein